MDQPDPFLRHTILTIASQMIRESGSQHLQREAVAARANVDPEVIEHLFDSTLQLVAEAQMSNYFTLVEPHHLVLGRVEDAAARGDEAAFWSGVEENITLAWSSGQLDEKWGIVTLLADVWSDPFTKSHFCDLLDIQFARWIAVVDEAKRRGWIDDGLDAKSLTAVLWSASVGQVITAGSSVLDMTPQEAQDFCMRMVRRSTR